MQRRSITVGVSSPRGVADKDIISFLSTDPECVILRETGILQSPATNQFRILPDLVVVDTGASRHSSLAEVLGDLRDTPSSLFIVAPDERFAVEAYQLRVCGYVTRPLESETFLRALEWAKVQVRRKVMEEQIGQLSSEGEGSGDRRPISGRLMVKSHNHIHLIRIEDIDWIEANAGYSWIHTQGRKHLLRGKMKCLEESLPEDRFVRIHRSLIVNIDRIRELQQVARGEYHAILSDGTALAVSRNYRGRLFSSFVKAS